MDKINMLNWQQIELQKKFGKKRTRLKPLVLLADFFLLIVSLSIFPNKDSQGFSSAAALSEPWLSKGDKWVL